MSALSHVGRAPFSRAVPLLIAAALFPSFALADVTVAWRVPLAGPYAAHAGAIAPDGTVYVQDVLGILYAVRPNGQLRWTFDTGGLAEGPLAITPDGSIIVSGNPVGADVQVHAVNPDGTRRWVFTDPGVTQGMIAGPAVGPDGNVYAVSDFGGLGVLSISGLSGELRWSDPGDPQINERGQLGVPITFGSRTPGGPLDSFAVASDMAGQGTATGLMFHYTLDGSRRWSAAVGGDANVGQFAPAGSSVGSIYLSSLNSAQGYRLRSYSASNATQEWSYPPDAGAPTNTLTQPTVGPDSTIYITRNLGQVHAVNPNGTSRWVHSTSFIFNTPVADPTNATIVAPGRITFGEPGFVKGLDRATGALRWTIPLPDEGGVRMIPSSRPWFSPDGRRAYITTTLPGSTAGGYLYAIDLLPPLPPCAADFNGDGTLDFFDYDDFVACFEGATCPNGRIADFNADGTVDFFDYDDFVAAFETGC